MFPVNLPPVCLLENQTHSICSLSYTYLIPQAVGFKDLIIKLVKLLEYIVNLDHLLTKSW